MPEARNFTGFSGQAFSLLGEKGRYVLPPAFRNLVKESSDGRTLCIDRHPRLDCLTGGERCRIAHERVFARCSIGEGGVTVVADAAVLEETGEDARAEALAWLTESAFASDP